MAKKKAAKKKMAKKSSMKKTASKKKSVSKKTPSATKKRVTKKKSVKKKTKTKAAKKKKQKKKAAKSLGRPRVTGDAKLEQFFKKDYEARQVFDFLRVETVKELEEFGPDEIVEKLTAPMMQTVKRIRKALAICNRCLKKDHKFALEFQRAILQEK